MQRRDVLAALAARQRGLFTAAQARAAGWTTAQIATEVRRRQWCYVGRQVLVDRRVWATLDATARHLCAVQARLLVLHPGWAAARRSAVLAHGLPYLGRSPDRPQLLRDVTGSGRATSRHERVATLPEADVVREGAFAVTSLERTVLDVARQESLRSAVVVADAALRRGLDPGALVAGARRCAKWPGSAQAWRVAALADGLAESPLESVSRVALVERDLPLPELQVEIWLGDTFLARVDMLWRDANLVGEADGRGKYVSVEDLYREKLREEALEAVGLEVVRWGWETVWQSGQDFEARIRRGLVQGARKTLDPGVGFRPTSLTRPSWRRAG